MIRTRDLWTVERDAMLRELVASGTPRRLCVEPLAALPGLPIYNKRQIATRMATLGLKLSEESYREAQRVANLGRLRRGAQVRMTPERLAYLREAYPAGVPATEILAKINAMPGLPVAGEDAIREHAKKKGLKRIPKGRDVERAKERRRLARAEYNKRRTARNQAARVKKPRKAAARRVAELELRPAAAVEVSAPPQPSPEIADAAIETRQAKVRAAVRLDGSNAEALANAYRMQLREVYRLLGERRREMRA